MKLSPREFYDFSLNEWTAAVEGLKRSMGLKIADDFPKPDDFSHLADRMGPSGSIR